MNYSPRTRLILEILWFIVSLSLLAIGWINYSQGKENWWYVLSMIFGALFLLYSVGSAIFYWRFHRKRSSKV
jgi:protein-S-isoprenylcysteine O-methyltransferase Ste14